MTAFRSRPTIVICLMTGTVVSIGLVGLVWAQSPAENWPFEEHPQTPATQPAPPPKSAVQKRLEELYQRDHRPLPDYMQQDGGDAAAPSLPMGETPAQRNQRESAPAQGNVRQQLSDYYQSQGKAMPAAQRTAADPQSGSAQSATAQPKQASASQPTQVRWYDRINPFHHSTSAAPPQTQVQNSAPVNTAANAASHSTPAAQPPMPTQPPAVVVTAQTQPTSAPAPTAKSGSFWGDLTLRRVPQQAANDAQMPTPISVQLGSGGHLVPRAKVSEPAGRVSLAQEAPIAPPVAASVTVAVPVAVAAPAVVAIPAEAQAGMPAAQKVSAANAVANDPAMPFHESSEADADQKSESGPYTGLTLEDEQSQLVAPKSENAKSAPHVAATHAASPQMTGPEVPAPAVSQHESAKGHVHYPQTTGDKVQLIGERVGQRGFKGFCPVVLRDQRELADANPAYCAVYRGQKYCFSSPQAQAAFEAAPHKYAPVASGLDVVVKTNSDQAVEGMLDFALWYRDSLYLFCSPESLQAFSNNPTAYAAAAQRLQ
jgi:YHS domain-containing protein